MSHLNKKKESIYAVLSRGIQAFLSKIHHCCGMVRGPQV